VRSASERHQLDPFLVVSLIRQESLFEPEAVSPADARGLMQLMPATARELSREGGQAVDKAALFRPDVNVDLGTTLLARLLSRYDGSSAKALAAYNAGQDAVAKWERRYGEREKDEFVELISYRETRDYVKAVLRNYRLYRRLYSPSDSATSAGSPPNAPFDITTMTSPGRAEETR
jgi:soluble lytic murein transglycosylase